MRFERKAWLLFLAGTLLRLGIVAWVMAHGSLSSDPLEYIRLGIDWAQTGHYRTTPDLDRLPGAPFLAAAGFLLMGERGAWFLPMFLVVVAGQLAIWLLWRALASALEPRGQLIALSLLQFGVWELITPIKLLVDAPAMWLSLLAAGLAVSQGFTGSRVRQAAAGALLGLTFYFRPDYLAVATAVPLAYIGWAVVDSRFDRQTFLAGATTLACAALVVLPWGFRNQAVTGRFFVMNQSGPMALYWAFNDSRTLECVKDVDVVNGPRYYADAMADPAGVGRQARAWMSAHPADVLYLVGSRIVSHFRPSPPGFVIDYVDDGLPRVMSRLFLVSIHLMHELWLVAGLTALTFCWRRLPRLLVMGAVILGARVPVVALYPDGGRFWFMFVPLLACCAIFFATSGPGVARPALLTRLAMVSCLLVVLQLWFTAAWGDSMYWYPAVRQLAG